MAQAPQPALPQVDFGRGYEPHAGPRRRRLLFRDRRASPSWAAEPLRRPPVRRRHKDGQMSTLQEIYEAAMRRQREVYGAAPTTVEALMYELRTDGVRALATRNCQRWLCDLSTDQVREVIERLTRLRARYPAITDELLLALTDQL